MLIYVLLTRFEFLIIYLENKQKRAIEVQFQYFFEDQACPPSWLFSMDLDLLSRLNDLSISSLKPKFLNKQPLSVGYDPKSFESFESHKFSSRILLNHKNMVAMNLKAGSLVKIMTNSILSVSFLFYIVKF